MHTRSAWCALAKLRRGKAMQHSRRFLDGPPVAPPLQHGHPLQARRPRQRSRSVASPEQVTPPRHRHGRPLTTERAAAELPPRCPATPRRSGRSRRPALLAQTAAPHAGQRASRRATRQRRHYPRCQGQVLQHQPFVESPAEHFSAARPRHAAVSPARWGHRREVQRRSQRPRPTCRPHQLRYPQIAATLLGGARSGAKHPRAGSRDR